MTPFLGYYLVGWIAFCLLAMAIAVRSVRVPLTDALAMLRAPWKLAIFVPAILFVTFAGRFTDDETWDVVSGGGMSVLTVATAWWSVGTAVRVWRRLAPPSHLVVAIAVALFSSSWFYDGWLLLRDHAYTARWLGNLLLSPTIYLCAGLVSSFELREGKLAFAFTRADWPRPPLASSGASGARAWWPMLLASIPLLVIAAWFLVGFVGWHLPFPR